MSNSANMFSLAWQYHQAGSFAQAEQLYRQILQTEPAHADAWCFMGAACQAQGKLAEAETNFRRAIQLLPNHVSAHNCLGVLLAQKGQMAAAVAAFEQGVQMVPGSADLHNNLGLAYFRHGQNEQALKSYRTALRLKPDYAQAYYNLGLSLNALGEHDQAIEQFRQALRYQPDYAEALNDLGNALTQAEKQDEALASYERALRLRPQYAEAHYNLAVVLGKKSLHYDALAHYQHALRIKPEYAEAYMNLANTYQGLWRFDEAVDSYQTALRYKPDYPDALHGLGGVLLRQGKLAAAKACFERALVNQPGVAAVQSNLLFCLNYEPDADPDEIFEAHRRWGRLREPEAPPVHANDPNSDRTLRIGYVSPDLRYHALARYLEPVLQYHDAERVKVYGYAEVANPDAVTERLQKLAHEWRWTNKMSDAQLVQQIREDRIDILVDLAGHTAGNRLCALAQKPAPVQCTWLGYMNTTGLTAIDYRFSADVLDPTGEPVRDTEELMRLPGGLCCFAPPSDAPAVATLPALNRGYLTFGSLHNLFKLNAQVYDVWSRILRELPTAKILMYRHTVTGSSKDEIGREFAARGIGPERLDLRQGSDAAGYLSVYEEIDVSLDTFPYTGGVTTCESLWMGVPVLSLCGRRPAGRNSAAILVRVGLADWVGATAEQYVSIATGLPENLQQLGELRAGLRPRLQTTLCDGLRFTRMLEEAYRTMWRGWCEKQEAPVARSAVK